MRKLIVAIAFTTFNILLAQAQLVNIEFPANGAKWLYKNHRVGSDVHYLEVFKQTDSVPKYHLSPPLDTMRHYAFKCIMLDSNYAVLDSFTFFLAKYLRNKPDDSLYNRYIYLIKDSFTGGYPYIANYIYNNPTQVPRYYYPTYGYTSGTFASRNSSGYGWIFLDSVGCYEINGRSLWGYKYTLTRDFYTNPSGSFCFEAKGSKGSFVDRLGYINNFMIPIDTCKDNKLGTIELVKYSDPDLGVIEIFALKRCTFLSTPSLKPVNGEFSIYPNPVKSGNSVFIGGNSSKKINYRICDMIGNEIDKGSTSGEIKVPGIKSGIYLIKLQGDAFGNTLCLLVTD